MKHRNAIIEAETVVVLCPHTDCQAEQPNPHGGEEEWTLGELQSKDGHSQCCVSCDKPFNIVFQTRVTARVK